MNKGFILAVGALIALSGCGTYAGSGAFAGASLGSVLGSAIGGIGGGWQGSNVGTVVGMAGGAIVGSAVGAAADQEAREQYQPRQRELTPEERRDVREHYRQMQRQRNQQQNYYGNDAQYYDDYQDGEGSGFTPDNTGDDRLYNFNGTDYSGDYSADEPVTAMPNVSSVSDLADDYTYNSDVEIVNARFVDDNHDNIISPNEVCKVIFEVMNRGAKPVSDVQPTVVQTTGNKHIFISQGVHVEQILPGKGIRYTAIVKADRKLKDGNITIAVSVVHNGKTISKVSEFNIRARK